MEPTSIVITTLVVIAGMWELYAFFTGRARVFSRVLQAAGIDSPFIAFVFGFLCGHIFGYMQPEPLPDKPEQNQVEVTHE